jgi:hypothetical protein
MLPSKAMNGSLPALMACALGVSSCGPDVPANPSYETDVKPILAARCLRCHSPPYLVSSKTAPYDFSSYASASQFASRMPAAITRTESRMPFGSRPLDDWQIETIENWAKGMPPNP